MLLRRDSGRFGEIEGGCPAIVSTRNTNEISSNFSKQKNPKFSLKKVLTQ
jgi:hypothetical protein